MHPLALESESKLAADIAACSEMLRDGSRTFFAASKVLPRRVCQPATALYAFCRLADDAVDLAGGNAAALANLHVRLDRAYDGCPFPTPADRALADTIHRFAIPRALPLALLEGLAWDAEGRRYGDLAELIDYAVRVAGTVGMMMSILMGARTRDLLARACDLGVAMQLTNIARDVGEDARAGRLYLPLRWLRAAGIDPNAWLARPTFGDDIGAAVQRLLDEAQRLYDRSRAGIDRLPLSCRVGIHAARLLYCEIGHEVSRAGCDSVSCRAVVPRRRKVLLLARAIASLAVWNDNADVECLAQAQYLLDAVAATPVPTRRGHEAGGVLAAMEERVVWVLDLFQELEQRQRLSQSSLYFGAIAPSINKVST